MVVRIKPQDLAPITASILTLAYSQLLSKYGEDKSLEIVLNVSQRIEDIVFDTIQDVKAGERKPKRRR